MATVLHNQRLTYLYGDTEDEVKSSEKASSEEVEALIGFVRARYELAAIEGEVDVNRGVNGDWEWFSDFIDVPEKRNYVFGKIAQQKLI